MKRMSPDRRYWLNVTLTGVLLLLIFTNIIFTAWMDHHTPETSEYMKEVPAPVEMRQPEPVEETVKPVLLVCEVTEVCEPAEPTTETVEPIAPAVEEPAEPEPPYTEEELGALALVIYQEAGADFCSDDTRLKVGTVVMNRVADDRFPSTIEEVLTQKAQYGRLHWTGLVWPERANTEAEAHAVERAYECAERILMGERFLPDDVVWQAEFTQGTEVVCQQEGFYFCR